MPCGPRASPGGALGEGRAGRRARSVPTTRWQVCRLASQVRVGLLQVDVRESWAPSAGAGGLIGEGPACPHCRSQISTESFLHLRYQGTDCALMVSAHQHPATARSPRAGDFGAAFVERYASSHPARPGGWPAACLPCPDGSLGLVDQVHEGVWLCHPRAASDGGRRAGEGHWPQWPSPGRHPQSPDWTSPGRQGWWPCLCPPTHTHRDMGTGVDGEDWGF